MSQHEFKGSCLCGAVHYQVSGEVVRFTHCHCGRCRKATGTGHGTNIVLRPGRVSWTRGGERVRRYKVPEAERFAVCFCTECGSPLPRTVQEMELVVLPAGSLDEAPGLRPEFHIFWDSRAEWSCDAQGLPTFGEYPPGG